MVSTGISLSPQNQRPVRVFAYEAHQRIVYSVRPEPGVSNQWFLWVKHVNAQLLTIAAHNLSGNSLDQADHDGVS